MLPHMDVTVLFYENGISPVTANQLSDDRAGNFLFAQSEIRRWSVTWEEYKSVKIDEKYLQELGRRGRIKELTNTPPAAC